MDIGTIVGLLVAFGAILGGQALEGGSVKSLIQPTAALIVVGGTFGACLVQFPLRVVVASIKAVQQAFFENKVNSLDLVAEIIRFAMKARKDGIISLESEVQNCSDPFLKKALTMAVDGVEPRILRETMEMEMSNVEGEYEQPVKFWEAAGGYSPTVGIIGAVLGLIHVMENLADPSKLGAGIAVAFVATVYGVSMANLAYLPIAGKLQQRVKSLMLAKEIMLVGVISILEGENPRLIEGKLQSFLSRKEQEESANNPASRVQKRAA